MKVQTIVLTALLASGYSTSHAHQISTEHVGWQACQANERNDPCSYVLGNARYTGSCQSLNDQLMCVRQKPIEYIAAKEKVEHEHKD